jgi:hypothetical protein
MKTVKGMLHHATDLLTAAISWVDLNEGHKATKQIKESIGILMEAESRLEKLLKELEPVETIEQVVKRVQSIVTGETDKPK